MPHRCEAEQQESVGCDMLWFGSQVEAAGKGIEAAGKGGATLINSISRLFTSADDEQRMAMIKNQPELLKTLIDESKDAMAMHAQFAENTGIGGAGARPALMWICAVVLAIAGGLLAYIGYLEGIGETAQAAAREEYFVNKETLEILIEVFAYFGGILAGVRGREKILNHFSKSPNRGIV